MTVTQNYTNVCLSKHLCYCSCVLLVEDYWSKTLLTPIVPNCHTCVINYTYVICCTWMCNFLTMCNFSEKFQTTSNDTCTSNDWCEKCTFTLRKLQLFYRNTREEKIKLHIRGIIAQIAQLSHLLRLPLMPLLVLKKYRCRWYT